MAIYNFTKEVNARKLNKEIMSSAISSQFVSLTTSGDDVNIETNAVLSSPDETILNDLITNHTTSDTSQIIESSIQAAVEFGEKLMIEFSTENVLMGITQAGKTKAVLDYLTSVKNAVDTGSLYVAMDEIDALIAAGIPVDLDPFVTQTRLETFKQKIVDFLT